MENSTHETDVHDLTLGIIHALKMMDVNALSYVQLRRLYAALLHTSSEVEAEIANRSGTSNLGETVRIVSPKKKAAE